MERRVPNPPARRQSTCPVVPSDPPLAHHLPPPTVVGFPLSLAAGLPPSPFPPIQWGAPSPQVIVLSRFAFLFGVGAMVERLPLPHPYHSQLTLGFLWYGCTCSVFHALTMRGKLWGVWTAQY